MKVELTRFRVKKGKSARVDAWLTLLNQRMREANLKDEKMYIETIFREKTDEGEFLYWYSAHGEEGKSNHEIDRLHSEFFKECSDLECKPQNIAPEVSMFSEKALKTLNEEKGFPQNNIPTIFKITCSEPWFSYIRKGIKPVEGRKNTLKHQKIQVGDLIDFSNGNETFLAIVLEIRLYASLEDYLKDVTFQKALPGILSFEEAINIYHQWSTPEEIRKHGFLGIFIKPIDVHVC